MKKLVLIIIVLALVASCSPGNATKTPEPTAAPKKAAGGGASAQGYLWPVKRADLSFRTGGRVAEVLVKEGDQVKTGQPLVKLQDAEVKAALAAAQAELKRLQAGTRAEEIAQALGQVMFSTNLFYQYNQSAVLAWLIAVVIISTLASIIPARNATRISVRASLAYT